MEIRSTPVGNANANYDAVISCHRLTLLSLSESQRLSILSKKYFPVSKAIRRVKCRNPLFFPLRVDENPSFRGDSWANRRFGDCFLAIGKGHSLAAGHSVGRPIGFICSVSSWITAREPSWAQCHQSMSLRQNPSTLNCHRHQLTAVAAPESSKGSDRAAVNHRRPQRRLRFFCFSIARRSMATSCRQLSLRVIPRRWPMFWRFETLLYFLPRIYNLANNERRMEKGTTYTTINRSAPLSSFFLDMEILGMTLF